MDPKLKEIEKEYRDIPIPEELDLVVQRALKKSTKKKPTWAKKWIAGVSVAAIAFVIAINTSSTVASAFLRIPGIDSIVKVLTFRELKLNGEAYNADVQIPAVSNLQDQELEAALNEKYLAESKQLFEQFQAEIEAVKEQGGGHIGLESGYEVITDNEQLLTIRRYSVNMSATTTTIMKYDTIDKKNEILLNLPMLFKDDQYIELISENIKEQMAAAMKSDPNASYYINTEDTEELPFEGFQSIQANQNFYINKDNRLVIAFDKHEVAPGYMGIQEFVIPTEVINGNLVSNLYIK